MRSAALRPARLVPGRAAVVAFGRTAVLGFVGMSTLLVGVMEAVFAEASRPGLTRTQPQDLEAAGCVRSDAEADIDAEGSDHGADRQDHGWHASCRPMEANVLPVTRGGVAELPGGSALRGCRAAAAIRGPPARG